MRRFYLLLAAATLLVAACGSSHREGLRADSGAETTTTVAAVGGDPGDGTATTLPGETTTAATEATTTTVPPFTRPPRSTTTTVAARRLVSNSTPSPSTTAAPPTAIRADQGTPDTTAPGDSASTVASTTTTQPLKGLSPLTLTGDCPGDSVPKAVDMAAIRAQLESEGYGVPADHQFVDSRGQAVGPVAQDRDAATAQWQACHDAKHGKFTIVLKSVQTEQPGSRRFASLVQAQVDIPPTLGTLVVS